MKKVIYFAPFMNSQGSGEPWVTYNLVSRISKEVEATVLTFANDYDRLKQELPHVEVVGWSEWSVLKKFTSLNRMLKPGYLRFLGLAKRWCRDQMRKGRTWDIAHHASPISTRFYSPTVVFKETPIVIGPVGGSLTAPKALSKSTSDPWYVRLRGIDGLRQRLDPMLRSTYANADCVLGVAKYVEEKIPACFNGRFEVFSEWGFDDVHHVDRNAQSSEPIKFLAVGRLIPTKGVRELIEAFAKVARDLKATLTIVGTGPLKGEIESYVKQTQLENSVQLVGWVEPSEVARFYAESDVFILPSYRESSGGVFLEAMTWGLPVICIDYGGPGYNVPAEAGIKVSADSREQIISDLGAAMASMASDRPAALQMGLLGRKHIESEFLWNVKIERLLSIYDSLCVEKSTESS